MAAELLKQFEPEIESLSLVPAQSGEFEVVINDSLLYSKLATHRHAEPGEVARLVNQYLHKGMP